jgi:cysteine sulfinate desulfinase/cysteine desulfurase-like protein
MGVPRELAVGALRFSLGHESTTADVARAAEVFPAVVEKVRKLSAVLGRA